MPKAESGDPLVDEFRRRCEEFQPRWNRNAVSSTLPGFLLFFAGIVTDTRAVALAGFAILLIGTARGAALIVRYRRCPGCDRVQGLKVRLPHHVCRWCGARLS